MVGVEDVCVCGGEGEERQMQGIQVGYPED